MFAVLFLPNFRLQAVLRFREELAAQPVAVADPQTPKTGVLEINEIAARAGVTPGQTTPQALARCAQLTILPRSPAAEQSAQAALLEIATTLAPEVEATAGGLATIHWQGAARVNDWPALGAKAVADLAALRLSAQAGFGPNPDLALLAARRARPVLVVQSPTAFLAGLAVQELEPAPELLAVLRDWGIHHLAQLTSLPRGEVIDRLGPEAGQLWERAAGCRERPLRRVAVVEEFGEAFDFEREIDTAEPVLFLLRRFLEQLTRRLAHIYRVAGEMTFTLLLADGRAHVRLFTIPSPTADVDVLFRILQTHLDGLRLEHAATGVRLRIIPTRAERQQFQLFETPLRDPNRFGETLGRLAALVGAENVGVVEMLDTHQPDRLRLRAPRFHELVHASTAAAVEDLALGLPLRRYRPPLAATVRMAGHHPVALESAKVRGAIRAVLGPYRASGGWWENQRWGTEEWDVEMASGGLYRLARVQNAWRLEGSYDEPVPGPQRGGGAVIVTMNPAGA